MRADSPAAAVYQVFLWKFLEAFLAETLKDDLRLYLTYVHYGPSVIDTVLGSGDVSRWRPEATLESVCREGLVGAVDWLAGRLGPKAAGWRWGRVHRYAFRHPGASGKTAQWLLNRGPYPAGGSCATVNVAGYTLPAGGFEVNVAPSVRFIVDMADESKMHICWPMGQSGQAGHRHYDDAIPMWRRGGMATLYMSRNLVEKEARRRLLLTPRAGGRGGMDFSRA
jgi:penicillin amidase